jgi:hypothetical protein
MLKYLRFLQVKHLKVPNREKQLHLLHLVHLKQNEIHRGGALNDLEHGNLLSRVHSQNVCLHPPSSPNEVFCLSKLAYRENLIFIASFNRFAIHQQEFFPLTSSNSINA